MTKYAVQSRPELDQGRLRMAALFVLLFACALGGGASRADVTSLLYVRPVAVICIATFLLARGDLAIRPVRVSLAVLGGLAAIIVMQLIPLPPGVWAAMPGHERYLEVVSASGGGDVWRPISLAPFETLNALFALLPPAAILLAMAGIGRAQKQYLLLAVIGIAAVSGVLGLLQITSGADGPFYLYEITTRGLATGLFANRNHHAVLLAVTLPALRIWTLLPLRNRQFRVTRLLIAAALGVFFLLMIPATGSRSGLLLGAIGVTTAVFIAPFAPQSKHARPLRWLRVVLLAVPVLLALLAVWFDRGLSIERLSAFTELGDEKRLRALPIISTIARDFFPFGTGIGSFDPVFRSYEPDAMLMPSYLNRAHNDLAELVMTGGLPACLLVVSFLVWAGLRARRAFSSKYLEPGILLARFGAISIGLILLASLTDYPLSTPLIACLFVMACAWLEEVPAGVVNPCAEAPNPKVIA